MVQTLYGVHDKTGNPPSHGHARAYLSLWPQIETSARKPRLRGRRPLADDSRGDRCVPGRAWGHDDAADLYRRGAERRARRPAPPFRAEGPRPRRDALRAAERAVLADAPAGSTTPNARRVGNKRVSKCN